jgi:hypothetical protein
MAQDVILSPVRLPFRHTGKFQLSQSVSRICPPKKPSNFFARKYRENLAAILGFSRHLLTGVKLLPL